VINLVEVLQVSDLPERGILRTGLVFYFVEVLLFSDLPVRGILRTGLLVLFFHKHEKASLVSWNHAPGPVETDGEAAVPGPGRFRMRRRGPRSMEAMGRRRAFVNSESCGPCPQVAELPWQCESLFVLHCNIRGLRSHKAELEASLSLLSPRPCIICLNETFLDATVECCTLSGFECVARRDRADGWGGVAVYAEQSIADRVVLLESSEGAERCWLNIHTDRGPLLLGCWYRPPAPGECSTIESLRIEIANHLEHSVGIVLVGDMNVHDISWLVHSARNSPEGRALHSFAQDFGLKQIIQKPTRNQYLLDLVLTNIHRATAKVLACIADHSMILVCIPMEVPCVNSHERDVWCYRDQDSDGLRSALSVADWSSLVLLPVDQSADVVADTICKAMREFIPKRKLKVRKCSHPWMTQEVLQLVAHKQCARGTAEMNASAIACSRGISQAYNAYVQRVWHDMSMLTLSSKLWWKKARELTEQKGKMGNVPALINDAGEWLTEAKPKADLFASTFAGKSSLPVQRLEDPLLQMVSTAAQTHLAVITPAMVCAVLSELDPRSATGPDLIPARVLKEYSKELSVPISQLIGHILDCGVWPECWTKHWIVPIYKRKAVFKPGNYRGVHLTAQLSKVVERAMLPLFANHLKNVSVFGDNQFAYQSGRGARDALALLTLSWVLEISKGNKVAVYCSDVSGAFDKVNNQVLVGKLRMAGVHVQLIAVIESWLSARDAHVVVSGQCSALLQLENMVFQGTVWGPTLWNAFFGDVRNAVHDAGFTEYVYADDLNAFRVFEHTVSNDDIDWSLITCQNRVHEWGDSNQVTFDASKESTHILSQTAVSSECFRILGVLFNCRMSMKEAVKEITSEATRRVNVILRARRFLSTAQLVGMYKCQVLSFIEYRTSALFHCDSWTLSSLDHVQDHLLGEIGVSDVEAAMDWHLLPLRSRRDVAMLGLIWRTAHRLGPPQFEAFFRLHHLQPSSGVVHDMQLIPWCDVIACSMLKRSALGLIDVWNELPKDVVRETSVARFQGRLSAVLRHGAQTKTDGWPMLLSAK
jgi:hypothetical protein